MDLKDLTPKSDEVIVELTHPGNDEPLLNDDGSTMTITLYAPHTREYKEALYEQTDKRLASAAKDGNVKVSAREIENSTLSLLMNVTKDWDITFDGEQPKMTKKKIKEVYEKAFWVRPQIEGAIAESQNFMWG